MYAFLYTGHYIRSVPADIFMLFEGFLASVL